MMFAIVVVIELWASIKIKKEKIYMKAYGHSRRDKLECKYGCCTGKSGAKKGCRKAVDKTNRKTARRANARFTLDEEQE